MRTIIHIDMDAFFASVEQLDDPELRGKPVLVGGDSARGVVAAASYEAREYGVRSAMSMVEARWRCPQAIVVFPHRGRYQEMSRQIFSIFSRFTPLIQGLSLDEAFLDVTGSRRLFGDGVQIAGQIRKAIFKETGLRASAGVACSKFVAKIASDIDKPNGLTFVQPGQERAFLAPLPIRRMWGVGPKAQTKLAAFGLERIGDLARAEEHTLQHLLGSWGLTVHELARGIDDRSVVVGTKAKSIGSEETFERDLHSMEALRKPILAQSIRVADRLVNAELRARSVTLKVKYADHRLCTRQLSLRESVCDPDSIYQAACELLLRVPELERGARLTGVSVSQLSSRLQSTLFVDENLAKRDRLEEVSASLRSRFGDRGMTRARLVKPEVVKKHRQ